MKVNKRDIEEAHERIKPYIHRTPLTSCETLTKLSGCSSLVFKSENLQKVGAFKPRGAFNKLLQLPKNTKTVCTHSSGNHAQGLAYAAQQLGFKAYIVMPENSPDVKRNAVIGYGANVITSGVSIVEREEKCKEVMKEHNATFIHPYDDYEIIFGQGTCGKEIFEEGEWDFIVCPIGGGGLLAGTLIANEYWGKKCTVIGVEPEIASDAFESLMRKKKQPQMPPVSIADGLRTSLGDRPYKILLEKLVPENIILVSEAEIIDATKLYMERMKLVIEPSSATVLAAVLKDNRFKGKKVCCIVSGGNIDLGPLALLLREKAKI